jgi:uncharacterized repeat protein (TIGR04076 family)
MVLASLDLHLWKVTITTQPESVKLMPNYRIKCEVVRVDNGATCQKVGDTFPLWIRTPANMCCRAFVAVYPPALAMRFSDAMPGWETEDGHLDVMCPDQNVVYRLTRMKDEANSEP